jgi:hypothetical protein
MTSRMSGSISLPGRRCVSHETTKKTSVERTSAAPETVTPVGKL